MKRVAFTLLLLALSGAACQTLEAHKKRLAGDPLVSRSKKVAGAPKTAAERARAAIDAISPHDERALGEAVVLRIVAATLAKKVALPGGGERESTGLELRDRALLAYVNHVGNLVALQGERQVIPPAAAARMRARRFTFGVLDTDDVGAWSTPGGYVLVSRGLLAKLGSESELAWVLAHEIAHIDYEDGLAALKADLRTRAALGAIGDAFREEDSAAAEDPFQDPAFFNAVADRFWNVYEGTGLARDAELRADAKGIECATKAGYDGQGAARALAVLGSEDEKPGFTLGRQFGDSITRVLTHGSRRERLSAMAAHLDKPGRTGAARYDRVAAARVEQLARGAP